MNVPMAMNAAPMRNIPRYPVRSEPGSGMPTENMIRGSEKVASNMTRSKNRAERYFPASTPKSVMGYVSNSSMHPDFFSSEKSRILSSGITNSSMTHIF